jgi:hypothetical protein
MTSYIHPENQEILWNIINNNATINNFFINYNPQEKSKWFKSIISKYYSANINKTLLYNDLQILNKETLVYMIKNVQTMQQQTMQPQTMQQQTMQPQTMQQQTMQPQTIQPQSYLNQYQPQQQLQLQQQNQIQLQNQHKFKQFENNVTPLLDPRPIHSMNLDENNKKMKEQININYETDYKSLFEKKEPKQIDFTEKEDKPLMNIEELIENHKRERELQMNILPSIQLQPQSEIQPQFENNQEFQNTFQENQLIFNPISENPLNIIQENNVTPEDNTILHQDVEVLKLQIKELSNSVSIFKSEIETMKNTINSLTNFNQVISYEIADVDTSTEIQL